MRLAVCDQQWLFASVLTTALAQEGHQVVMTTDEPGILLEQAATLSPDLCVLDVGSGPLSAVEVAERLHELVPAPAVVMLADFGQDQAWDAYDQGLLGGIVNKACALPALLDVIARVGAGERVAQGWATTNRRVQSPVVLDGLTARELEVLRLVVQGHSTQTMADQLGVSRHTIRTHVQQVLRKLGVHNRGKLARAAAAAGLVDVATLSSGRAGLRT
jgi:DNA-binding NarL/FixJ family response regulator